MTRVLLIPGSTAQNTLKVKNITFKFMSTLLRVPLIFTVIYVPEGSAATSLTVGVGDPDKPVSLYEPIHNVIMQGQSITQSSGSEVFDS
jgi:hypothetical protein